MLINIEGVDGCGKNTQTKKLYEYLVNKGYKCKLVSFPNYESKSCEPVKMYLGGELGEDVDCLDPYQTSVLFAVDRLLTMKQIDVSKYDYILFDRYVGSNMIHQASRFKEAEKFLEYLNWAEKFEFETLGLPKPDKVLFLDMPIEMSLELKRARTELKNGMDKDIMEKDEEKLIVSSNSAKNVAEMFGWIKIDCGQTRLKSVDEIHQEILTKLGV